MKFITTIFSVLFSLSIQAQLVTYPGTLSTGMPHNDDSVSYTHLDVYKRQALCRTNIYGIA